MIEHLHISLSLHVHLHIGTPGRTRTCAGKFRKLVLYPLSYGGKAVPVGFEPTEGLSTLTSLANLHHKPLDHSTVVGGSWGIRTPT